MRILLQTTIPFAEDDWHIGRFSLLAAHLRGCGHKVDARDREPCSDGHDAVITNLARTSYHEMWLFGADVDNGLSLREVEGIDAFRRRRAAADIRTYVENAARWLAGLDP
jgi:hypothetical protein